MSKTNLNFGNIEVKKSKFKFPVDINKVETKILPDKVSYGKKAFKYLMVTKLMIKSSHCVWCFQYWVDMLNALMELSRCPFLLKTKNC